MKTETTFTPGPWKFLYNKTPDEIEALVVPPENDTQEGKGWLSKTISIGNSEDECLAEVRSYTTKGFMQDLEQFNYNARLIVYAPEMFKLLEEGLRPLEPGHPDNWHGEVLKLLMKIRG